MQGTGNCSVRSGLIDFVFIFKMCFVAVFWFPGSIFGFVTVCQMKRSLMKEVSQRLDVLTFMYFTMACFDLWRIYLHYV